MEIVAGNARIKVSVRLTVNGDMATPIAQNIKIYP
jgi:hypothetical protein